MPPRAFVRLRILLLGVALLVLGSRASAQSALCVEYKGKACPVLKVVHGRAFIKEGDKLVSVAPGRSVLVPQPEFLPYFVSVRNLEVKTSYLTSIQMAGEMNNEFHFNATFESSYRMENPFLVLELDMEQGGKRVFFQEIGPLAPGHPEWVRVVVALPDRLGPGKFKLHIFSDGLEVLHSQQPEAYREGALNKMVVKRIAGVKDAPPRPLVGPVPEYPAALRKKRVEGEAVVAMRITHRGVVTDPVVQSATDPAFGEAALVAVRQWRFLPHMKDGKPVEAHAAMPFSFEPPDPDEK